MNYIAADISSAPPSLQGSFYVPSENCLQRAHTLHRRLCRLLLVAHRGLHTYYSALIKEIPQLQQTPLDSGEPMQNSLYKFFIWCMYNIFFKKMIKSKNLCRKKMFKMHYPSSMFNNPFPSSEIYIYISVKYPKVAKVEVNIMHIQPFQTINI